MPHVAYLSAVVSERSIVPGHAVVVVVPSNDAHEPRVLLSWRIVSSLADLLFQGRKLCGSFLPRGAAHESALSIEAVGYDVREAQEVERLRPRATVESTIPERKAPESKHPGLLR